MCSYPNVIHVTSTYIIQDYDDDEADNYLQTKTKTKSNEPTTI